MLRLRLANATQAGEQDCSAANNLMRLEASAAASLAAVERAVAKAAAYEAADRQSFVVALPLDAQQGENDCSAASTYLHGRWSEGCREQLQTMEDAQARAAAYEAADRHTPVVSLPLDAQQGEADCSGINLLMHERAAVASVLAVQDAQARAAVYEAADRLQPAVSLPLDAQQGERDCRAINELLQGWRSEGWMEHAHAMERAKAHTAAYVAADQARAVVSLPLDAQQGEADCRPVHALLQKRAAPSVTAMERGRARASEYEAADRLQPAVHLALGALEADDYRAAGAALYRRASPSVQAMERGLALAATYEAADAKQPALSLPSDTKTSQQEMIGALDLTALQAEHTDENSDAVDRALARAAMYEAADRLQPTVSLPVAGQQGEADCRAASALQHERAAASVEAMQRGITQSASYTAADRQLMVRLPLESQEGEADLSAASALMQQMWSSGCEAQLQAVERALARAALYEAADSTQPAISLPLDAQQGEPDCVAVNAMQDGRSGGWRAQLQAVERALARAAMYEMADRLQPTVSLPLDAQQGEADCSGCNQLLHERAGDSVQAVERALARAAEYEAADAQTPVISLPLDAQQGEADCGAVHALCLHKRAAPSLRAMQRGLQQAASYEVTELLEGLPPHVGHAHAGREHPLCALSSALWRDLTALGVSLDSAEAMTPYLQNMQRSLLRERERLLLRQGHADQQLLHKLSHHLDTTTYPHPGSYADPTSAAHTTHLAAAFVAHPVLLGAHVDAASTAHAMHLAASIAPGPALQPYAPHAPSLGACAMEGGDPAATTAKTPLAALRSSTASLPQGRGKAMQKKKRKHRRKNSSRVGVHPKAPGEPALRSTQGLIRQVHAS